MSRTGTVLIALAVMGAGMAEAGEPFSIPAWLQPYPGANEEIKTSPGRAVATYEAPLSLDEMVAFHRGIFAARKIPFHPEVCGTAAAIRVDLTPTARGLHVAIRITAHPWALRVPKSGKQI